MAKKYRNGEKSKPSKRSMANYRAHKCVIGLDQSYTRCGVSIAVEGKLKKVSSIKFKGCKTKTEKRLEVQRVLRKAIESCLKKYPASEVIVFCERLRLFSSHDGVSTVRPQVIKPSAAMICYIVDTAAEYGIETWSVDTRAWKASVLGDARPVFEPIEGVTNPQKFGSVRKVIELGFRDSLVIIKGGKGKNALELDDDAADSACIALYGFVKKPKLKREW